MQMLCFVYIHHVKVKDEPFSFVFSNAVFIVRLEKTTLMQFYSLSYGILIKRLEVTVKFLLWKTKSPSKLNLDHLS